MALGTEFDVSIKMGNMGLFQFICIYKITPGANSFLPCTCRGFEEIKGNI